MEEKFRAAGPVHPLLVLFNHLELALRFVSIAMGGHFEDLGVKHLEIDVRHWNEGV